MATRFGTGDQVDAYVLALLIPSVVVQVLAQSFATSLMPVFIRRREAAGPEAAAEMAASAAGFGLLALAGLVVLLWLAGPLILRELAAGFSPPKLHLAWKYYRLLAPIALFQGGAAIWGALLNASGRFATISLLPAITPVTIIAVLASPKGADMHWIAVATVAGAVMEALTTIVLARRAGLPWPRLSRIEGLGNVWRQSLPMAAGMALTNGNLLVDQYFAGFAGAGGLATLRYGNNVPALLVALAALPLGTAVLPFFSGQVARRDMAGLRHSLRLWSAVVAFAAIPLTVGVVFFSHPIVELMYQRGSFLATDTTTVTAVQQLYVLQLPFFLLGTLGGRMLIALGLNRVVLMISSANFVTNVVLDYALFRWIGLPGIALSTSLVYAGSSALVFLALHRRLRK